MRVIHKLIKIISSKQLLINFLDDLRSTSANVMLVGGVSSFFGFTNHHYVIICGAIMWIYSSVFSQFMKEL